MKYYTAVLSQLRTAKPSATARTFQWRSAVIPNSAADLATIASP